MTQGLAAHEAAFVMQGVLSNHESQPVIVAWLGVRFASARKTPTIEPFAELAARTGLTKRLTNDGGAVDIKRLDGLREPAVAAVKSAHSAASQRARGGAPAAPDRPT
jgi:hypothetical protein